jgi:alanine dehydrogenase
MKITSDAIGVIGTSFLPNEKRIPLIIEHLLLISRKTSKPLVVEAGYGAHFDYSDSLLKESGCIIAERDEILAGLDLVVIPKPTAGDIRKMKKIPQCLGGYTRFSKLTLHKQPLTTKSL